ncbi:hypothetical protein EXN66_Car020537 [Channa argus]|uniref:Uncharacterized protein n=1 Tax=Channa argus TaxID=215402 RepID=A0A6G1QQV4_CHAAH|nr:hypothetical protein EXN66_Car020537 [Channa argus]
MPDSMKYVMKVQNLCFGFPHTLNTPTGRMGSGLKDAGAEQLEHVSASKFNSEISQWK